MAREMACRKCKRVTTEKVCPACKSSDLTPDWNGVVLVAVSYTHLRAHETGRKLV